MTFVHPWFLLGLAALAVPVILHLMNRQIALPLRFPSIRFIRSAHLPREGRRRLQDLLLLLLRLLALAAGVLAFARPQWHERVAGGAMSGVRTELVLVVDQSASMQGWDAMPRLRAAAAKALADNPDAASGLVAFDRRVLVRLAPDRNPGPLRDALARLQPGFTVGEPGLALREALGLFRPGSRHRLVVLSDFQLSDWQAPDLPVLPAGVELELVDVNPGRSGNCGLSAARVTPLPGGAVRVAAAVRNWGQGGAQATVSIKAGPVAQSKSLDIPALQTRETVFVVKQPGTQQAEISLAPDAYPADNRYLAWLGRPPALKILAVTPGQNEPAKQAELLFLRKALETATDAGGPDFQVDSVDAALLPSLRLEGVPALFLLGVAGYFQDAEWQPCRRYVQGGGVLVCTSGATAAQQAFGLKQQGLLNADFAGLAAAEGRQAPFAVTQVNPDCAVAALLADSANRDLLGFAVYRYARLKPAGTAKPLLTLNNGDPLLLEQVTGKGRSLVFAMGLDLAWSEFPMSTAFVPVLRELLKQALPPRHGARRLDCGQPVPGASGANAVVAGSAGDVYDTSKPGIILAGAVPYEVNVPGRESVIEKTELTGLRRQLLGSGRTNDTGIAAAALPGAVIDLWPACALAAALLLVAELLLGAWLDSRRVAAVTATDGPVVRP